MLSSRCHRRVRITVIVTIIVTIIVTALGAAAVAQVAATSGASSEDTGSRLGTTHYLRGGYQLGYVLPTNPFVEGENAAGEPIEWFHSLRLEFGWQTDGTEDWHQVYGFPSYGLGLYGAEYLGTDELGTPTSLYGFFSWPVKRWSPGTVWNVDAGFGLTADWQPFDPIENPHNVAIGLGRSVHIDIATSIEFRLGGRWGMLVGVSGTHFSNGGSQQPNSGINQIGPYVTAKYNFTEIFRPPVRRELGDYEPHTEISVTFAGGVRNWEFDFREDPPPDPTRYYTKDFFVGDLWSVYSRRFSHKSLWSAGISVGWDESRGFFYEEEQKKAGNEDASAGVAEKLTLGPVVGYELEVNNTRLLVHMGYNIYQKDIEGTRSAFFQRLGLKQHVFSDWFVGLNVKFHDFSRAYNLEWNLGRRFEL